MTDATRDRIAGWICTVGLYVLIGAGFWKLGELAVRLWRLAFA